MGTYDNSRGAALHNPDFDHGDDITVLELTVLGAIEDLQELQQTFEAAQAELADQLTALAAKLVPAGSVLRNGRHPFGSVNLLRGNARGATEFEVVSAPALGALNVRHPNLTAFVVDAYPLNAAGERLSGRAGNASVGSGDTVTLGFRLSDGRGPDDSRSGNDMVVEVARHVALLEAQSLP